MKSEDNRKLDLHFTPYVFVHGTLKRGGSNHYLLEDSEFVCTAQALNMPVLCDGGFPSFDENSEWKHRVQGELYRVDSDTLERLDYLEGHPHFFYRTVVKVETSVGFNSAWCYFLFTDAPACQINEDGAYEWK